MPDILGLLMWPIKWVLEAILAGAHAGMQALGMDPTSGLVWVLSIAALTLVVRTAMIPLTVRQILSSRKALEVAPEIKKIQDRYRGKKDQFSREAMQRETMEAYRKAGTNPFASCLPLLVQMPIFFGLVTVLQKANHGEPGVGFMTVQLAEQFRAAALFDLVPLRRTMQQGFEQGEIAVVVTSIVMTLIMVATQFYTQLQIMSKNQTPAMKESPMYKQQRIILYVIPLFLLVSAWAFPIATMFYWLVSNIYTLVQQLIIISKLPNPGSDAALAREARMARKRQRQGLGPDVSDGQDGSTTTAVDEPPVVVNTQRQQPKRKGTKAQREGGGR